MCPVGPTLFDSLAKFLQIEILDDYECSFCHSSDLCMMFNQFDETALVFVVSLLRFKISETSLQYEKDTNPCLVPMFLDTKFLNRIDPVQFLEFQEIIPELLKIYLNPWLLMDTGVVTNLLLKS